MVAIKGRKSSNKNPPMLSHEFVIQNHADIVSCVAMVFVLGLMVQVTSPWAYTFIAIHHNVSSLISIDGTLPPQPTKYTTGWKDPCAIFFYFLITIIMHAVIQEYIFDKISKRLRLSKSKLSKFNESSQLVVFYALSVIWGMDIVIREHFVFNVPALWMDYPAPMSFSLKLFFIGQLAYWFHCYPELYFQRAKKEEIPNRVFQATVGVIYTLGAYILNYQHVGIILLILHHVGEGLLHSARLIHFVDQKEKASKASFYVANSMFVIARILTVLISALVFVYGLNQIDSTLNCAEGNFNIPAVRYSALAAVLVLQFYMLYVFLQYQKKRARENEVFVVSKVKVLKQKQKKKETSKKSGGSEDDEQHDADQNIRKNLRSRSSTKVK
ncbi:PREDICTED: translocating chain-associated membrane protein 1-like 1 [Ceratosolen solmsi marchali]|uniref:Translocating chain-associated membrane protein 1-like 1 n=1 Tax=Ceratosolen solmsi marchali TaxID=326594 RepID=A0AAJ6YJD0_9HYME|nr:PREDICTED: translocating chain-associated membrane protein 1-like 1 [Ceratosolen solmsi marchali]